jgi:hypothetical protein
VARLTEAGIEDFVFGWPETPSQEAKFEHLATTVVPTLR